jgi:voltage-gated potassium channel Kch
MIAYLTFIIISIDYVFPNKVLDTMAQVGLSLLIFFSFSMVLKEAMSLRSKASNMILISITGYMIIGLIGGFVAEGIDQFFPDSYYHSTDLKLDLYNYIYYSFVTMTTLGYGDIIPISNRAQSFALMLVLVGQLYLAIIMAMNIAKFMQNKK